MLSNASMNEALRPATKTLMNTTRPTPIMSAAAVVAVRDVLRIAFSRPRRPEFPASFWSGQPSTRARGRITNRVSMPTPINTASAPTAMSPVRCPTEPLLANPEAMPPIPRSAMITPTYGEKRDQRVRGSVEPSRSAAIGGIRVARTPGMNAARIVTIVPTMIGTITVRALI